MNIFSKKRQKIHQHTKQMANKWFYLVTLKTCCRAFNSLLFRSLNFVAQSLLTIQNTDEPLAYEQSNRKPLIFFLALWPIFFIKSKKYSHKSFGRITDVWNDFIIYMTYKRSQPSFHLENGFVQVLSVNKKFSIE